MKKIGLPPYYQTEDSVKALQSSEHFQTHIVQIGKQPLSLVQAGNKDKPLILFIHGSPGQWTAWADYLIDETLSLNAHMIAVDRVGFGGSDAGTHEPSLTKQSQYIMKALEQLGLNQKIIVVGHSYGGPVALRMAVDYLDKVQSLILLAPSIDPALEDNRWYNKLAGLKLIRAILPKAVDRSNQEILPLQSELTDMQPLLKNVTAKVTLIQGEKDKLVPAGNADYGKKELSNIEVHLRSNRGHFIPWQEYDLVKQTLLDHLQKF